MIKLWKEFIIRIHNSTVWGSVEKTRKVKKTKQKMKILSSFKSPSCHSNHFMMSHEKWYLTQNSYCGLYV